MEIIESVTKPSPSLVAEHFDDLEQQRGAAQTGMWVVLATEGLFFGRLAFQQHADGVGRARRRTTKPKTIGLAFVRHGILRTRFHDFERRRVPQRLDRSSRAGSQFRVARSKSWARSDFFLALFRHDR